ncbi:fimbrial protein [uncultured Pluralibacter sp.]|uniref:fimbrial protein n=1 Tax=uncultured Pluralibacter sp. TaxID=1490864 RepID=UPI00260CF406|nr:fimbrial protein [uncultured Pluralibacter sp.]
MKRLLMIFALAAFSRASYATCHGKSIQYAPPISVDLSEKLTPATPEWTDNISTQYSGSFTCTTGKSKFGYTKILSDQSNYATILGFSNGKYYVRAEITNDLSNNKELKGSSHSASELNTPMTIRFSLVSKGGNITNITGDSIVMNDVLFVTDLSGMNIGEILTWPLKQLGKILQWLTNGFHWPYDDRDMYGQPMTIRYAPKQTTCTFTNPGMSVVLPTMGRNQVLTQVRPGYTPFTLNIRCDNLAAGGTTDRNIEIFLSSNTLLSGDPTVLIDSSPQSAKGVGLRLVKREATQHPLTISSSTTNRGNATALFIAQAGGPLSNNFSIPMGVYYYTWAPKTLTQGTINTTATLNVVYP